MIILGFSLAVGAFRISSTVTKNHRVFLQNKESHPQTESEILWSYVSNLQRSRRKSDTAIKSATSLAYFLKENRGKTETDIDVLTRAVVQGIRAAAESRSYQLILQLLEGIEHYAGSESLIEPRILGEAIRGLHKSRASLGKIKTTWAKYANHTSLANPVSPLELNSVLEVLGSMGKMKTVLGLYHNSSNISDEYSISIVLNSLKDSISSDQEAVRPIELPPEFSSWGSSCWQWNEAVRIISEDLPKVNGVVITNLLHLNTRANQVFRYHYGPEMALEIWSLIEKQKVTCDEKALTELITNLGRELAASRHILQHLSENDELPGPGTQHYAAVIAVNMRAHHYRNALELLQNATLLLDEESTTKHYNDLLSAISCSYGRQKRKKRIERDYAILMLMATFNLLERANKFGPGADLDSYNLVLMSVRAFGKLLIKSEYHDLSNRFKNYLTTPERGVDGLVDGLLQEMNFAQLKPNAVTFSCAIEAVSARSSTKVLKILNLAKLQLNISDLLPVFNSALDVLGRAGYLKQTIAVYSDMLDEGFQPSNETLRALIIALGQCKMTKFIPPLVGERDMITNTVRLPGTIGSIDVTSLPPASQHTKFLAVSQCFNAHDYTSAKMAVELLRKDQARPSDDLMNEITRLYATSALEPSKRRKNGAGTPNAAGSKALTAYFLLCKIEQPSKSIMASVAKACAHHGYFERSVSLLRRIHELTIASRVLVKSNQLSITFENDERLLQSLQQSLLKSCASRGNVTAALKIVDLVQATARDLRHEDTSWSAAHPVLGSKHHGYFGMSKYEWMALLISASKSGHWKVCLSTLQFLKPYVKRLHPEVAQSPEELKQMNKDYARISRSLSWASNCLAIRSQYGWLVRSIEDWIVWSGRRPPIEAVAAATRVLSKRRCGAEVVTLLEKCTSCHHDRSDELAYSISIFVQAITNLHREGLYESADDVFLSALTNNILPFHLQPSIASEDNHVTLDLHGMNLAVAHCAVRVAMQQGILAVSWNEKHMKDCDLIIITGRGQRSKSHLRPVLRPEVQRMLLEEFYPPISTSSIPGNTGALHVSAEDIREWLTHQRAQTGARLMTVASILKGLSSGERLRKALTKSTSTRPTNET